MTVSDELIKNTIRSLLHGKDYRYEVLQGINADFMQYALSFFEKVVHAKMRDHTIGIDWYKAEFLNSTLSSDELIIHSGLNKKTVSNMHNTGRRDVVIEAVNTHYEALLGMINSLVDHANELDITLRITFKKASVELNMNESLIVINTLAVKRAELRGGAWSSIGKQVEKSLMVVLAKLFSVPDTNYQLTGLSAQNREVDFFLIDTKHEKYRCEVKLMGKGNPESADAFYARDSQVFVADKLSVLNKAQLDGNGVHWVELRCQDGYKRFGRTLEHLGIPHTLPTRDFETHLDEIMKSIKTDLL